MKMTVALDMDGVIVDFVRGACDFHEVGNPYTLTESLGRWDMEKLIGMTEDEFWRPLRGHGFWAGLKWTEDGKMILAEVERVFGAENIFLLSKPHDSPESASGKVAWIQRNLPQYSDRYLLGPSKQFCAHANAVLIDDSDKNVESWKKAGGVGVLVPRPWNSLHQFQAFDVLRAKFEKIAASASRTEVEGRAMTKEEYFEFHRRFCQKMMEVTAAKNHDYTGGNPDPFANFTKAELLGICSTEQGFLVRISDKLSRLISFVQKGVLEVKDETVIDSLHDLANYAALMAGYIESKRRVAKK